MEIREIMTPAEVGKIFRVDGKTVSCWAANGLLAGVAFRTPSGRWRFYQDGVYALLEERETVVLESK